MDPESGAVSWPLFLGFNCGSGEAEVGESELIFVPEVKREVIPRLLSWDEFFSGFLVSLFDD